MQGLNKVELIGHLGNDPDVRQLKGDQKVAHIGLATTESYRDKEGKLQSVTDWHALVIWGKLAEVVEKYLHKGSLIYAEGKLKHRTFADKTGKMCKVTEVIVDHIIILHS